MAERISVIVPVYNVAGELQRCLDSILAQTVDDLEVVAVDDGSTDDSGLILDRYAEDHANLRVIHKENGGVTSARLRGVAEARGEWIGFVDGDDEIEPDMYERLLKNAWTYGAEVSHCGVQMVFPDGRVHFFYNTGKLEKQDRMTALRELLSGKRIEPGLCNKLFHRELFERLLNDGIMPADIRINEDLLMNFYLFSAAEQTVYEDWCPYHYIVRQTAASREKLNEHKIRDPIRVKENIREAAEPKLHNDAQRAYLNTCINIYHELIEAGEAYRYELRQVRRRIDGEKSSLHLLGKKRRVMAWMILYVPSLYGRIYSIYSHWFRKNVYT